MHDAKLKEFKDTLPALKDKCEADIKNGIDHMPSFIMAKNTYDECTKMMSDRQLEIDAEKQRKKDMLDRMKLV